MSANDKHKYGISHPKDDDRSWESYAGNRSRLNSLDEYISAYDNEDTKQYIFDTSNEQQRRVSTASAITSKPKTKSKGKYGDDNTSKRGSTTSATSRVSRASNRRKLRKVSMEEQDLPAEWVGEGVFTDFDLEIWWRRSPMFLRVNAILVGLLLTFAIIYFIAGVIFIVKAFQQKIISPYVCQTTECQKASTWLTEPMDTRVDPCENFYEYMCYNYKEEESGEGIFLSELVWLPAYKVEFGANSILAKILKNFRDDPAYDQTIRFYQACLNESKRNDTKLNAFMDTLEIVFGTKDFSNFESTSLSMEEIGANLMRHSGEASYINMAFYIYPYILILRPSKKIHELFQSTSSSYKEELIIRLFKNLLPSLGENDAKQITDSYHGVEVIAEIEFLIYSKTADLQFPKDPDNIPQSFIDTVKAELAGRCPPMGIRLDITKMLKLFIQEDFRIEYYDLMAFKYFEAFKICFDEDPSKFTAFKIDHPKTAFVAPWIFGLFWDFLSSMDTIRLMEEWKIGVEDLPGNDLVFEKYDAAEHNIQLRCLLDLTTHYGYMPAIRYLTSTVEDPAEYLQTKKDEIYELIEEVKELFFRIPHTEVDINERELAKLIFGREFLVDVMMPLVGGLLDVYAVTDELRFGEDHLENSFKAIKYTVERARLNWIASTNPEPVLRWWGLGEPWDIQGQLFDIRQGFIKTAEFVEEDLTMNKKLWYKFLGRPHPNYALLLLSVYEGPYNGETLFLQMGSVTVKIIQSIYSFLNEPFADDNYLSFEKWSNFIFYGTPDKNLPRKCSHLYDDLNNNVPNTAQPFTFVFDHSVTTGHYTWGIDRSFRTMLSLKHSLKLLRERRKKLSSEWLNWNVPDQRRKQRMNRFLPGKLLSNFSEEQLFLMTFVRNTCRGSWKTSFDDLQKKRFLHESTVIAILMQLEEFQTAWNCKKNAFMSNDGNDRCVQWTP